LKSPRTLHGPFVSVSKAVEYIRRNFRQKIAGPDLARASGLSERNLNRKFQEAFGMAPHEFVMRTRIQAASEAPARSDQPLMEIAFDHGFCDQSAFTVQFRKRTGLTLSRYFNSC
jgi:AraC-like DNA-binding protein